MTLPYERTRAVLAAGDFLLRVANVYREGGIKGIRAEVRQEARWILRHYPLGCELADPDAFDAEEVRTWMERMEAER